MLSLVHTPGAQQSEFVDDLWLRIPIRVRRDGLPILGKCFQPPKGRRVQILETEHHEKKHVPLVRSPAPTPAVYKRNYLVRGDEFNKEDPSIDFDVVTELVFPDRPAFAAWLKALSIDQIGTDEQRFLNRSRTRAYVVQECVSSVPCSPKRSHTHGDSGSGASCARTTRASTSVVLVFEVENAEAALRLLADFPMTKAGYLERTCIPVTVPFPLEAVFTDDALGRVKMPDSELEWAKGQNARA